MNIDLEKLKQELKQISKWPWCWNDAGDIWVHLGATVKHSICFCVPGFKPSTAKKDAKFIAKAPERIAALIEEVEQVHVQLVVAHKQIIESAATHDQIIEIDENGQVYKAEWFYDFKPTPKCINALPEPIRRYIHDLETRCDPAGDIQYIAFLKESSLALRLKVDELEKQLSQYEEPTQE